MKELSANNLITYSLVGTIGLFIFSRNYPPPVVAARQVASRSEPQIQSPSDDEDSQGFDDSTGTVLQQNRPLRMSISVDHPTFLKVRIGQAIQQGDVISDNSTERDRLDKQRQSVELQVKNLKSKPIIQPTAPTPPPQQRPIPPANYAEEEAAIAQTQMKLAQARSLLAAKTPQLKADNPEKRAEVEKATAALQSVTQKLQEQQQLLQSMKDMKLPSEILQHEQAKLGQLELEQQQAKSGLEQARARFNYAGVNQQQQLQQLQLDVQIAQSELDLAESRLLAAQSRRQMLEYNATAALTEHNQRQQQLQQEYERQQQTYLQSLRERDYQLAQLNISLTTIEDKLAQIPIVRSPRHGYIRRIKPWVGRDGKYTTTITISPTPVPPKNGGNSRTNTTTRTSQQTTVR